MEKSLTTHLKWFLALQLLGISILGTLVMADITKVSASDGTVTTIVEEPDITITEPLKRPYWLDFVVNNVGESSILLDIVPSYVGMEKWDGIIHDRYRSIEVNRIRLSSGESNGDLSFRFSVPADVQNGVYRFTFDLKNDKGIFLGELDYHVTIAKKVVETLPALIMEPRYEILDGYRGETFSFQINLTNTGEENLVFDLGANLPRGWTVKFKPRWENTRIRTIVVDPDIRNTGLEILVSTPETEDPGLYDIEFVLNNEDIGPSVLPVKLKLAGRPVIEVETLGGRLDVEAVAGNQSDIVMTVANTGSGQAGTVRFLSQAPEYWDIRFDPTQVTQLMPGETAEVAVTIVPPDKTIPGDYYIRAVSSTVLGQTDLNLRVAVARPDFFGMLGILIILAVVGANLGLFYRMSNR